MATQSGPILGNPDYPISDGRPMAETDVHRQDMADLIETLQIYYRDDPDIYVSGNLLMFCVRDNKRKHVSPDVFVVKGVPKGMRLNYLVWEEGKSPDFVIELTSSSTRAEDTKKKFALYRDTLKVNEYFLFDPYGDHLDPRLQGYRLVRGDYVPMRAVRHRLPSKVLGLHLEAAEEQLRLYNPATDEWLPIPREAWMQERARRQRAEAAALRSEAAREQAEAEIARLRAELERLQRGR